MIKVLICEDQTLVRQGLVSVLSLQPEIEVVGEASTGTEAIEKADLLCPDIVLMDIRMPMMDGVEATRTIAGRGDSTRVIILSTYDYEEYVFEGVKAGAMGYVLKDMAVPDLVNTIKLVHGGETFIQPAVASKILFELARSPENSRPATPAAASVEFETLSEREIAIIQRLAQGMSNREVADDMALAEGTVRNYVSVILSKVHAANRVQAINWARERKII